MAPLTLCLVVKYPPIEGGVSQQSYWLAHNLARAGHRVHVVTNADEVELRYRIFVPSAERGRLEGSYPGGGYVRLHNSNEPTTAGSYIPYANPFVSKLASLACGVVREHGCDLLWASYFEPYGVAALLTSELTGVPYAIRHAGSDLVGLAQIESRRSIYLDVLRRASIVSTGRMLSAVFRNEGVLPQALYSAPRSVFASGQFTPDGPCLDIDAIVQEADASPFPGPRHGGAHHYDPTLPTIGIYGKVSAHKGMGELVRALGQLKAQGRRFNFVAMVGGHGSGVDALRRLVETSGSTACTTWLPLLPHWLVPQFIRGCTLACYLENRFPVEIHTPQVGWEIMACATPLVLSAEVASKAELGERLVHGDNVFRVEDPTDVAELARVVSEALDDPLRARQIGQRGRELVASFFPQPDAQPLVTRLRRVLRGDQRVALREFQQTLTDLYTDEAFRRRLRHAGPDALEGRDLSDHEQRSLCELGQQMAPQVQRFGTMLIRKRLEFYLEIFPTVAALLHIDDDRIEAAFAATYQFHWKSAVDDVEYFASWLRAEAARHEASPPFDHPALCDALRFDLAMWRAETEHAQTRHGLSDLATMSLGPKDSPTDLRDDTVLTIAAGVEIETFDHPVHRLVEAPTTPMPPRETHVAFTPRHGLTPARAHTLSDEMLAMLRDLDPTRTIAGLLARVEERHRGRPPAALAAAANKAVGSLVQAGIAAVSAESASGDG